MTIGSVADDVTVGAQNGFSKVNEVRVEPAFSVGHRTIPPFSQLWIDASTGISLQLVCQKTSNLKRFLSSICPNALEFEVDKYANNCADEPFA